MDNQGTHPLRGWLQDPTERFQLAFSRTAASLVADTGRVRHRPTSEGLVLDAFREDELNEVLEIVRTKHPAAVLAKVEVVLLSDPEWLEPYVRVNVITPADTYGDVIGDLHMRRGSIESLNQAAEGFVVTAVAPLAELLGYDSVLGALTQGRGSLDYEFLGYRPMREPPPQPPRAPAAQA